MHKIISRHVTKHAKPVQHAQTFAPWRAWVSLSGISPARLGWLAASLALVATSACTWAAKPNLKPEVDAFVAEMADKHGFDQASLKGILGQARHQQSIIDAMNRPAEAKPWRDYRKIFLTEDRARGGERFWSKNEAILKQAEERYGVPPEIITAIIGVETRYGANTGRHRVLDSLVTLAFDYPKRGKFFRGELEQFLLLTREEHLDPLLIEGSYAGAMGQGQFIASSYRSYAVDFDSDGHRDLWRSQADAVGSVANYFNRHGWQAGQAVAERLEHPKGPYTELVAAGMKPSLTAAQLLASGIEPPQGLGTDGLASLILLDGADGDEYWLGLNNFYVITRYNHSNLYAMAVYQLGQWIRQLHEAQQSAAAGS